MSQTRVPNSLREQVSSEARYRCGYCLTSEAVVGTPMELDHLIPEALGGLTVRENLWLACSLCNNHKADRIAGADPTTGEVVRLFDLVSAEGFCLNGRPLRAPTPPIDART